MKKVICFIALFSLAFSPVTMAQSSNLLKQQITQIITDKKATIGVAISGTNKEDTVFINSSGHFPMLSVFKFPIAIVVLSEVDKGKLSLSQKIKISKKELSFKTWSPIKDKYPNGVTLTLAEIIRYTVSESDNIGCDILLRLIGGTEKVENYFHALSFKDVAIKATEHEMHQSWDVQYRNWITPGTANALLHLFYYNKKKILSEESYRFLFNVMEGTKTGNERLRGQLPPTAIVAHKTGSSGTNNQGLTAATNDIGIIFLPDGRYFFISVFVSDSKENATSNEKIIADIAKVSWDYFSSKK